VRLLWNVRPWYTIWMAISHASENSSRFDADIRTNDAAFVSSNGTTTLESSFGTHHLPPENVLAYQLGQRGEIGKWLAFDLAMYYNHYTNRHTQEPAAPFFEDNPPPLHLVLPTVTMSNISGESHGLEAFARLKLSSFWNLSGGYTLFQVHLHQTPTSQDFTTADETEDGSPWNAFQFRSEINLPHNLELDNALYFVGALSGPQVPSYTRVDIRFGWQLAERLDISVGGQNLLNPSHFEFGSGGFSTATQVGRIAYGKFTWRF
jgi:iron complex outermembrane receptor protein